MACTRRLNNARCCCLLRSMHASATTRRFSLWSGTARERARHLKRLCSKQLARLEADIAALNDLSTEKLGRMVATPNLAGLVLCSVSHCIVALDAKAAKGHFDAPRAETAP